MEKKLLSYMQWKKDAVAYTDLINFFEASESTVTRYLKKLINKWSITKIKTWRHTFYALSDKTRIQNYFQQDYFLRDVVQYNPDFLRSYIPNETSFFGEHYTYIQEAIKWLQTLTTRDYKKNIRVTELMLIDLSFSSSKLEWNTYSYLDTELLVKSDVEAKGKSSLDTQMILNHKHAIQYCLDTKNTTTYTPKFFREVHALLWTWLLHEDDVGVFRNHEVRIAWSTYEPLSSRIELSGEFDLFVEKLNTIKNPYEQSIFILTFIPYFQAFLDINKRTSRISAISPLVRHGLPILSMLQIDKQDYIAAIISIYELNDTTLLAELYVQNYLLNMKRYIFRN